ncbi:MAG: tripartite tricarboxylate transporter permease [Gammaproteobacteria bacterium]|nr:tripartite tricarboxylate transporter permease [Gammaproteobacteria bacterium]
MWEGIAAGLATAIDPANLAWVALGCLAGTLIGMLPGLGPITAIALMIPVSYSMEPAAGLIMMAGVYYGAVFGGSTSSILINAPGVASTVATSFDGYPMARAGQAGRALALAAYASFSGGVLGALALLLFAGVLAAWATAFQSPDYTLVLILALSSVAAFAERGLVAKSCVAALLGLMLGTVGADPESGVPRFTFGRLDLMDGIAFILVAMATFALADAFHLLTRGDEGEPRTDAGRHVRLAPGDARAIVPTVGRNSVLGFLVGVLPGAGATLASFFAYTFEKRFTSNPACGVAAPESANNAACMGSFVPLLTLGIPGSGTTAVLLGVMLSLGIQPGPRLLAVDPGAFWGVIVSMFAGNLVLLALNLPLIPWLSRLIRISRPVLIPFVVAFSLVGVYLTTLNDFDLYLMLGLAAGALVLRRAGFPLAPLLLGFILSGMLEENLRRTLYLADGSWGTLAERPLTVVLAVACALVWIAPLWRRLRPGHRADAGSGQAPGES